MTGAERENRRSRLAAEKTELRHIREDALSRIRAEIEGIKARKRGLLGKVREGCRGSRARLRARVEARRAELKADIARLRVAERTRCKVRRAKVRKASETRAEAKRREAKELRGRERFSVRLERERRKRETAHERRAENDDAVRDNLEPELVPIFNVVKAKVRARPGMSRTEAFLLWVHEHEGELWSLRERQAEAKLRVLLKEEQRAARDVRKCGGSCGRAKRAALPEAPF